MNKEIQGWNLVKRVFPNTTVRKSDREYIFTFENYHTAWPFDLIDSTQIGRLPMVAFYIAYDIFDL